VQATLILENELVIGDVNAQINCVNDGLENVMGPEGSEHQTAMVRDC